MPSPLRCPRDLCTMEKLRCGLLHIDRCPICAGIWLDRGELTALRRVDSVAESLDIGPARAARLRYAVGALRCPRDQRPLQHAADIEQPHVSVEHCHFCRGIFLDAGELADLSELTIREWLRGLRL